MRTFVFMASVVVIAACSSDGADTAAPAQTAASSAVTAIVPTAGAEEAIIETTTPVETTAAEVSRASDVDFLLERLDVMHPNPWHDIAEAGFVRAAEAIASRADALDEVGFMVEVMRLLVMLGPGEGHTGVFPGAQEAFTLRAWPIWPYIFEDGVVIVSAADATLEGTRIVAVGDMPIGQVLETLTPLVSRDNESTILARLPEWLILPEILAAAGVVPDADSGTLTVSTADGAESTVRPDTVPFRNFGSWLADPGPFPVLGLPPDPDGPLYLRDLREPYWLSTLPDEGVVWVGYNHVNEGMQFFAPDVRAAVAEIGARAVIVDVRHNGGGDNTTYWPLIMALDELETSSPGTTFVVAGRVTFSAAGNFVADVSREAGAALVGEASGGGPNQYGDGQPVVLPASGLVVSIPTVYHEDEPGGTRDAIPPDLPAPPTWAGYAAGRDPAFDAVLASVG